MVSHLVAVRRQELVIGLTGPIGVNIEQANKYIQNEMRLYGYDPVTIKLTDEMQIIQTSIDISDDDYIQRYNDLIDYANEVRIKTKTPEMLAILAISAIRRERLARYRLQNALDDATGVTQVPPLEGVVYIIRQLKRPEEVDLLRNVYGDQFILVAIHTTHDGQVEYLKSKTIQKGPGSYNEDVLDQSITRLINRDLKETNPPERPQSKPDESSKRYVETKFGQNILDTFPKGEVFVSSNSDEAIKRFFKVFFGFKGTSPAEDEYGMYLAKAASLRSLDLSRQVGAAIIGSDGSIVSLGCNEVPKAKGGIYGDGDTNDKRDFQMGYDPNEREKRRVLHDLISRLKHENLLNDARLGNKDLDQILADALDSDDILTIRDSRLMDIIEFGRVIHAEMHALTEAARVGRAVAGATLYCTTFPCHLCAKHIVASGIARVVYIEPYAKSYARALHSDSISIEESAENKVLFSPFLGISPYRYRTLFEEGRRKDKNGSIKSWSHDERIPRLEVYVQKHDFNEDRVLDAFKSLLDP